MKSLTSRLGDLEGAVLAIARPARRRLGRIGWRDQPLLLQLVQQGIEPPITQPRERTYHVIDDLGDQVAVDRPSHEEA